MKLRIPQKLVKIATIIEKIVEYRLFILALLAGILFLIIFYTGYVDKNKINNSDYNSEDNLNQTVYKGNCSDCHNKNLGRSGVDTNRCGVCHENSPHGNPKPPSRFNDIGKKTIHKQHSGSVTNQKSCLGCHSAPACNRCHSGHASNSEFIVSKTCQECHGSFPEPRGHQEERSTFKQSAHFWMGRCNTCHKGAGLGFKNLATYNLSESSKLCSNCHSAEFKDDAHYKIKTDDNGNKTVNIQKVQNGYLSIIEEKKCVDCHNPHTVSDTGLSLEELSSLKNNFISMIDSMASLIINNAAWTILITLLICSVIVEHIFRPKKGNIILSKGLTVEHNKSRAKAIRITSFQKLNSYTLRELTNVLDKNSIDILGISAGNEETVLFIDVAKDIEKKEKVIGDIKSIDGIIKAEYTKDFEK